MRRYIFVSFILFAFLPLLSAGQGGLMATITGYDAKCNGSAGGSAIVTPSGGVPPYSYVWTPAVGVGDSVSGLAAGVYSVTVTDNAGNTTSGFVTISQPAPLVVIIDSIVVMPCQRTTDGSCGCSNTIWAVVSGGTPPYSYLWTPDGLTGNTVNNACYIEWTVSVTDNNNCLSTDSLFVVKPATGFVVNTTGVNIISNSSGITVYPNPADNRLNIRIDFPVSGVRNLEVYDMAGQEYGQQVGGNVQAIVLDVSSLAAGNYFLKIEGDGESQKTAHFSVVR